MRFQNILAPGSQSGVKQKKNFKGLTGAPKKGGYLYLGEDGRDCPSQGIVQVRREGDG